MSYVAHPLDSKAPAAVPPKSTLAHAVADYAKPAPKPVVEVHPAVAAALAAHFEASKAEAVAVHPEAKAAATEAKVQAAAAADAMAAGQPEKAAMHAEAAVAAAHTAMIKAVHPAVRAAASMAKSYAETVVAHATGQALTAHETSQPNATARSPEHEKEVRMYSTISTWMATGAVALAAIVVVLRGSPGGIPSQSTAQSLKLLGLVLALILGFLASGMGLSIAAIPYSSESRMCFSVNARERAIASSAAYGVGAGVALVGVIAVVRMVYSESPGEVDETKLNAGMLGVVVAALIGGAGSLMTMSSAKASTKLEASSSFFAMLPFASAEVDAHNVGWGPHGDANPRTNNLDGIARQAHALVNQSTDEHRNRAILNDHQLGAHGGFWDNVGSRIAHSVSNVVRKNKTHGGFARRW